MKTKLAVLLGSSLAVSVALHAQTTAFTYQGRLQHGGAPASGLYEMYFTLYDAVTNGNPVGVPVTVAPVPVTNGLFTVALDFGAAAFMGADRWLEISVTVFGSDQPVVTLVPRQSILPMPYALHAANAAGLMSFVNAPLDIKVNGQRVMRLEATGSGPNIIGGASVNGVAPGVIGATIGGGGSSSPGFEATNRVEANYGTISGGLRNSIGNLSRDSTISGGGGNTIQADSGWSTIGGGESNTIERNARYSTIGGGLNKAGGFGSVIGGGSLNTVRTNAEHATVGGGLRNFIAADAMFNTIAGGNGNTNSREYGTIGGGDLNRTAGFYATVGGGRRNTSSGGFATVAGGYENAATEETATVGGGFSNMAGHEASVVAGGSDNIADADYATIGGGSGNSSIGDVATVSGGLANTASGQIASIGGGQHNTASGWLTAIGGGEHNSVQANYAVVGGGFSNRVEGQASVISGGGGNRATDLYAVVGGGGRNQAAGPHATVGGGLSNSASGTNSAVGGGWANQTPGHAAAVPGGALNLAAGGGSFAAGSAARALHDGSFVWSDGDGVIDLQLFSSTTINEFAVRARGGVRFVSAIDTNGSNTAGVTLAPGSGSWSSLSDRNAKENFATANTREILDKVAALPLASWNYKAQGKSVRHLGPTAQDFHAAFGLGESDRTIATVDAAGVALAAIQGLNQKLEEHTRILEAELKRRDAENADLKRQLNEIKTMLREIAKQKGTQP